MIYLDYNATTPIDEVVRQAMLPFITHHFGNPSSNHEFNQIAKVAVEQAREQVAKLLNAYPDEIYFTSGGSEANNMAIKGLAWHEQMRGKYHHITDRTSSSAQCLCLAEISHRNGARFHTDAVQSVGKIPTDVQEMGVDFLTIAGHERDRRAGTENVILDVALGQTCEIARRWVNDHTIHDLTQYFWAELQKRLGEKITLNGHPALRAAAVDVHAISG